MTMTLAASGGAGAQNVRNAVPAGTPSEEGALPKVYLCREITSENLVRIYEALGRKAHGRVAVKVSTGEPGGHNFLQPALIKDLVQQVRGTI